MKMASRAPPRSGPSLVAVRNYSPGVYRFLFPSIISSLQVQQPASGGSSTPSPAGKSLPLQLDVQQTHRQVSPSEYSVSQGPSVSRSTTGEVKKLLLLLFVLFCFSKNLIWQKKQLTGSPWGCRVCVCVCVAWTRDRTQTQWQRFLMKPTRGTHVVLSKWQNNKALKILEFLVCKNRVRYGRERDQG